MTWETGVITVVADICCGAIGGIVGHLFASRSSTRSYEHQIDRLRHELWAATDQVADLMDERHQTKQQDVTPLQRKDVL